MCVRSRFGSSLPVARARALVLACVLLAFCLPLARILHANACILHACCSQAFCFHFACISHAFCMQMMNCACTFLQAFCWHFAGIWHAFCMQMMNVACTSLEAFCLHFACNWHAFCMHMHDFASILRARCFVVFLQRLLVRALLGAFSCAALLPLLAGRLLLPPLAFCVRACVVPLVYPRILRVFGRFRSRPRARALSCASSCVGRALVILAWLFASPRAVCASRASCWLAICMR